MFWRQEDFFQVHALDIETESLQTDIQRFVGILGFCLMAIFALVQSIPVTNPEQHAVIEDLQHQLYLQERELDRLRSENRELKQDVQKLQGYPTVVSAMKDKFASVRKTLDKQRQTLDRLAGEKITEKRDMAALKDFLEKRAREIDRLKKEKKKITQMLAEARQRLKPKTLEKPEPEKKPSASPKPEPVKKPPAPPKPERKGLYVAFESNDVFMELLRAGKVYLYIEILGTKQVFHVQPEGRKIDFKSQTPAEGLDLWEAKEAMVPRMILDEFRRWTTLASLEKLLLVGLTPGISAQIRSRKATSGSFIIKSGGKVSYTRNGA